MNTDTGRLLARMLAALAILLFAPSAFSADAVLGGGGLPDTCKAAPETDYVCITDTGEPPNGRSASMLAS